MIRYLLSLIPLMIFLNGCSFFTAEDEPHGRYQFDDEDHDAELQREQRRFNPFP